MLIKWFAVTSVTALVSLSAFVMSAGCSSTTDLVTESDDTQAEQDAGTKRPQREAGTPPSETTDEPESCKDENATFTPAVTKPTADASSTACTEQTIQALAEACLADPAGKTCSDARKSLANKKCAECVFTESADEEQWKVFIVSPPSFNQRGCMDHVTGVKECGRELGDLIFIPDGCLHTYCGACSDSEVNDCNQEVLQGECRNHLVSGECANAWQRNNAKVIETCFGDGSISDPAAQQKDLFVKMAKAACMADAENNDGG